jgi:hypothetical protein
MVFLRSLLCILIFTTYGYDARKKTLRKTVYSHVDRIAAPILAYPDDRSCNKRCDRTYPGAFNTPYCGGRGDTTGTYFCCQYSTCCNLSYCCAPGYHCSEDGGMCTAMACTFRANTLFITVSVFIIGKNLFR